MDNKDELEAKDENIDSNNEEKEPTTDLETVEHRIDNIVGAREMEEKRKQAEFLKKMENLDFRRDYYMSELEKMYDRIPTDMYYKSEYEQITNKYNEFIDKMEQLENDEDFKKLLNEFESYRKKRLSANKAYYFLAIFFTAILVGIVVYLIIAGRLRG
ncbi:MAG: hypothetical protein K6B64_00620 [Acholeplasmatales bacterium]|nr:hypothetical protein [Acholeplasmatales bacterium]